MILRLRVKRASAYKKEFQIAALIIRYHCRDDEEGISAINRQPGFSRKDKERAVMLYRICKDMDGLDRVRLAASITGCSARSSRDGSS